jgi:hypothetical protein
MDVVNFLTEIALCRNATQSELERHVLYRRLLQLCDGIQEQGDEIQERVMPLHSSAAQKSRNFRSGKHCCHLCDRSYENPQSLGRHLRENHGGEEGRGTHETLKCEFCAHSFLRKDGLKRHVARRHDPTSPIFPTDGTTVHREPELKPTSVGDTMTGATYQRLSEELERLLQGPRKQLAWQPDIWARRMEADLHSLGCLWNDIVLLLSSTSDEEMASWYKASTGLLNSTPDVPHRFYYEAYLTLSLSREQIQALDGPLPPFEYSNIKIFRDCKNNITLSARDSFPSLLRKASAMLREAESCADRKPSRSSNSEEHVWRIIIRLTAAFRAAHSRLEQHCSREGTSGVDWEIAWRLKKHGVDHRYAKKDGFAAIGRMLRGKVPHRSDLKGILGLAQVAGAMREVIANSNAPADHPMASWDKFLNDLDRLAHLLAPELIPVYEKCVYILWGKEIGSPNGWLDNIHDRQAMHSYFQDLLESFLAVDRRDEKVTDAEESEVAEHDDARDQETPVAPQTTLFAEANGSATHGQTSAGNATQNATPTILGAAVDSLCASSQDAPSVQTAPPFVQICFLAAGAIFGLLLAYWLLYREFACV